MKKNIDLDKRIIFALDVNTISQVEKWLGILKDHVKFYKIGLELFVSEGMAVVDKVIRAGCEVMLDLKLYDIPQTVFRTVKEICKKEITFLTVHGNLDILKAAVEGAAGAKVNILGVTVLTSLDEKDLREMGYPVHTEQLVLKRAELAQKAGCAGVVASGLEAKIIREKLGDSLIIVTPGIRPGFSIKGDHKRVLTPKDAILNGSDYLVIGRPIRDSQNPVKTISKIKEEIKKLFFY